MKPRKPTAPLVRVSHEDVEHWFCDAWPGLDAYPNNAENYRVAVQINIIVDSENSSDKKVNSNDLYLDQRKNLKSAIYKAKKFRESLDLVEEDFRPTHEWFANGREGVPPSPILQEKILAIEKAQSAIDDFLELCPLPNTQDHKNICLWIADAADTAWVSCLSRLDGQQKTPILDKKGSGSLAAFIRSALEGIGLAGEGIPGYSLETISDHLRDRQNRPRNRRKSLMPGVGAN
ncbi:hypothetical protein [Rhizorhabdus wittichii]|uniref:hypothetical protein n=1 Tax=Rhizorhabdus wittichii TaxID=160791 RepID=UPI0012FDAF02|nr:hypothetical protein [Rhizorhabdus wittichii]